MLEENGEEGNEESYSDGLSGECRKEILSHSTRKKVYYNKKSREEKRN